MPNWLSPHGPTTSSRQVGMQSGGQGARPESAEPREKAEGGAQLGCTGAGCDQDNGGLHNVEGGMCVRGPFERVQTEARYAGEDVIV